MPINYTDCVEPLTLVLRTISLRLIDFIFSAVRHKYFENYIVWKIPT